MIFDETSNYKNNGHYFYEPGQSLSSLTENIPELPGIFYIIRLARGGVDLVYIGKSQSIHDSKMKKVNSLRQGILYFADGKQREPFLEKKMKSEKADTLDIYWFVTMDKKNNHLPEYALGLIKQKYYEIYGELPLWDESF